MQHLSPHGFLFVALQVVVLLGLAWWIVRHHARRRGADPPRRVHLLPAILLAAFVAWYAVLRVQPLRRGADPVSYTLGVFDGVSLAGVALLLVLHLALERDPRRPAGSATGKSL